MLKGHDMTPRVHIHSRIENMKRRAHLWECVNSMCVYVRVCWYLGEGCYPLCQLSLHLRQRLRLPHGLLELLLCQL